MSFLELFVANFRGRRLRAMETLLVAFLSALLFFSLVFALSTGGSKTTTKTSSAPVVITVNYGDVTSSITQAGKVVSEGTAYVSPKTQSRLTNLYAKVGNQVTQGTLLATLENTTETQNLAQAKVALNVAVTQLSNSLANIKALQDAAATNALTYQSAVNNSQQILQSTQAQVDLKNKIYQNAVDQAQVSFNQAQSIYNSYAQLVGPALNITMCQSYNTVNPNCTQLMQDYTNYQNAQIALSTAQQNQSLNKQIDDIQITNLSANYQSALLQQSSNQQKDQQAIYAAQRGYATLATQFGVSKPNPAPEDFVLAQLAIANAQQALDATFVRAPITGVITAVGASLGQNAPNGGYNSSGKIESLFTISSSGSHQLEADFNLVDGLKIHTGEIATVTFAGLSNPIRSAKIVSILKMPPNQDTPPSYRAAIQITGQHDDIYPGLAGTAEVAIRGISHVLIIPNIAVITKVGKSYVSKIDPQSKKTVLTPVVLGLVGKSTSQVISGLALGDSILLQKDSTTTKSGA